MNKKIVIVSEIILFIIIITFIPSFFSIAESKDDYRILYKKLLVAIPFSILIVIFERYALKKGFPKK